MSKPKNKIGGNSVLELARQRGLGMLTRKGLHFLYDARIGKIVAEGNINDVRQAVEAMPNPLPLKESRKLAALIEINTYHNEQCARYYREHLEERREYNRLYQRNYLADPRHPERKQKQFELNRSWVDKNRDYVRTYALKRYHGPDHDKILEQHKRTEKKYYKTHKKEIAIRAHKRYVAWKKNKKGNQ